MKQIFAFRLFSLAAWCGCLFFLASCGDDTITSPQQVIFPDSNVSYTKHVQPFFNVTCNFSGCHDDATQAGGIAFTNYNNLFSRPGMVVEKHPENSILWQILVGPTKQGLPHRQSFQDRITQNNIDGIKTWIKEGAQYN